MTNHLSHEDLKSRCLTALSNLTEPGNRLMIAVSGGSDSMGLLHLSALLRDSLNLEITAGFVDHGLRDGVESELALVKRVAEDLRIELFSSRIPEDDAKAALGRGSLQSWARDRRYALLLSLARTQRMTHLATAHTCNDQAETVLIRLLRGTGLDGIAGIPQSRDVEGIRLIRPLLNITREDIRRYLSREGIPWVDDPSNRNPRFLRTRVRHELLPLMNELQPDTTRRLAALATDTQGVVSLLESEFLFEDNIFIKLRLCDGIKVEYEHFEHLSRALWGRLIRRTVKEANGSVRGLERAHVAPIATIISHRQSTGALPLPGTATAFVHRGTLYVFSRAMPPSPEGEGRFERLRTGFWRAAFPELGVGAVEIHSDGSEGYSDLAVRARRPGDRLYDSKRRLKDVLSRALIPRPYRDFMPVVAKGSRIVACPRVVPCRIPGVTVAWRLDARAPIRDIFPRL